MKKIESIDYWYKLIVNSPLFDGYIVQKMYKSLQSEYPAISTIMLEQTCNLNCRHCFFKPEQSSKTASYENDLRGVLKTIIPQLPKDTSIVDGGRILREWHIPLLEMMRSLRKDVTIGMVDNGTYLKLSKQLLESTFRLDWIDVSIDGTEKEHNLQRNDDKAYAIAIEGLIHARKYISKKGKVTSLFSASNINYYSLSAAANFLFERNLVDEFHITPVSPVFRNKHTLMNIEDFKVYWEEVRKTFILGERYGVKVFTRMYQVSDMKLLAETVGSKKLMKAFRDTGRLAVGRGCIRFVVDSVPVIYVPLSICPSETFLINPDGYYRLAYSIQFTLDELHKGVSANGENTVPYTVAKIQNDSVYKKLYAIGAAQWQTNFGMQYLNEEFNFFKGLIT